VSRGADSLSAAQARRLALAAQGFVRPRPAGAVDRRHLRRMFADLSAVQIDSVNVLSRAHYLPAYSRLGGYPQESLDRLAYRDRELFEYWGHEASLLPVALHPLLRWRMARARDRYETWGGIARLARAHPDYVQHVLALVRERGPLTAGDIAVEEERRKDSWGWNWSRQKTALEYLFWCGDVTAVTRRGFERVYDVTERVLPAAVLAAPTPTEEEAHRALLLIAARALGVATATDLADYFRIRIGPARARIAELHGSGLLQEVAVAGWRHPAYVVPGSRVPRRVRARALLAPFDPLVWERARTERLFGFTYRIEIYVPAERRQHGYYVLPFLLDDRLAARVDLKADRQAGVLLAQAAWAEPGEDQGHVAGALAAELRSLASWLGLGDVRAVPRGDLAPALAAALG
jgi:uncharacterized protein YcaQ